MRDFSEGHRWLSLNTATVRKQGDLLQIIEACARHGIRAIDPWRDQVAAIGLDRAARAVRDAGLELSGYCRGGMFTADAAHRQQARDDNRRAVDEAKALGAPCIVLVAGGLPQYSRPGSATSKDIAAARAQVEDAIAHHAAVVENVLGRHQPVADVKRLEAILSGAFDLRQHIRIPPDVVDVERNAEQAGPVGIKRVAKIERLFCGVDAGAVGGIGGMQRLDG